MGISSKTDQPVSNWNLDDASAREEDELADDENEVLPSSMVPSPPRAADNVPNRPRDVRDDDDEEDYERDGWRIGFDVAFHGVGIAGNDDSESDLETPPIAAADDSSSEAETDPDSDAEIERSTEGAPEGYVALRTFVEDPSDPREQDEEEEKAVPATPPENLSHRFVSPGIQKDFEQALKEADTVYSNHSKLENSLPSSSSKQIDLDNNTITEIRNVMANVSIPEPYWAKDLGDAKVLELLEKLKRKEKE